MKVGITGGTGMIGRALFAELRASGLSEEELIVFTRTPRRPFDRAWNPVSGQLAVTELNGIDAVVNLAGESVAGGWWTKSFKKRLIDSRIESTELLVDRILGSARPPKVLVSASAIGIYGNRNDEILSDGSPRGTGFLADLCTAWEQSALRAQAAGVRVVTARIGIVLSKRGGALRSMLPLFRLGLGGRIGSGAGFMSWIELQDLVRAIRYAVLSEDLSGPVNLVAPHPVRNREFVRALGRAIRRPTPFPVPAFALRAMFGEMAEELLLSSTRVAPDKLLESGFTFAYPELESGLRAALL